MYKTLCGLSLGILLLAGSVTSPVWAQATNGIQARVTVIAMQNPDQQFELAAKLQWNASYKRWDKILVTYNGHPTPPLSHPVWSYLSNMKIPQRAGSRAGENALYKVFYSNAYCSGVTPLASGKPLLINFERNTLGRYEQTEFFRDWNCPNWNEQGMRHVNIVTGAEARRGNDRVLQLNLPAGRSGCAERGGDACVTWKPHIGARLDTLTYSYWIKFSQNFDFAAGGRLPGVSSVTPLAEGTKPNGQNGWSVSTAWNPQGQLGQYVYHLDQPSAVGEFWAWESPPLTTGQWHQVKTALRLNSAGQANGTLTTWLDGKLVLSKQNLRFRLDDKLPIERLLFNVFYTGRAPSKAAAVYIDDFSLQSGR